MPDTTTPSPGIVARQLTKSYQGRPVLHGVTLAVAPGEILGLLGPNGIGKSTTLRLIAGVDCPDTGSVTVAGIDAAADPLGARRQVGYLPDVGGLIPRLTVSEHLTFAARMWGLRDWGDRRDELVARLGLTEFLHSPAGKLSHGMSRRCGLALALLPDPPVILADEPFDGVDPVAGAAVVDLLAQSAAAGGAVICSTHLLGTAKSLCHRVAIMGDGRIRAVGPPGDLAGGDLEEAYRLAVGP